MADTKQKQKKFKLKEVGVDNQLIKEQNEDIHALEKDVAEAAEMVKDFNQIVVDQQPELDRVEEHVGEAESNVKRGEEILNTTAGLACSARWKICIIIILCIVIIVVILAAIGIAVGVGVGVSQNK